MPGNSKQSFSTNKQSFSTNKQGFSSNKQSFSTNKVQTTGRRKEAVARVRVMEGNSQIMVNGKPIGEKFPGLVMQKKYQKPFEVTKTLGKYTATVKVEGGGQMAQLDAIVHGVARSLAKISEDFKHDVKKAGLLTRDPRARERRKFGLAHSARAKKQSPKR